MTERPDAAPPKEVTELFPVSKLYLDFIFPLHGNRNRRDRQDTGEVFRCLRRLRCLSGELGHPRRQNARWESWKLSPNPKLCRRLKNLTNLRNRLLSFLRFLRAPSAPGGWLWIPTGAPPKGPTCAECGGRFWKGDHLIVCSHYGENAIASPPSDAAQPEFCKSCGVEICPNCGHVHFDTPEMICTDKWHHAHPEDAVPVADGWEPTISFADIAAKFPDHPWEVADDQGREYRVDRVAPTVDGTLVIWIVPLCAHPEDAPRGPWEARRNMYGEWYVRLWTEAVIDHRRIEGKMDEHEAIAVRDALNAPGGPCSPAELRERFDNLLSPGIRGLDVTQYVRLLDKLIAATVAPPVNVVDRLKGEGET